MDDAEFQGWMRRVAAVQLDTPPVSANAIWWRAELRRRLIAEARATRPIRIFDVTAAMVCALVAGMLWGGVGRIEVAIFAVTTAAFFGGVCARVRKRVYRVHLMT